MPCAWACSTSRPPLGSCVVPVADGGEGTVAAALAAGWAAVPVDGARPDRRAGDARRSPCRRRRRARVTVRGRDGRRLRARPAARRRSRPRSPRRAAGWVRRCRPRSTWVPTRSSSGWAGRPAPTAAPGCWPPSGHACSTPTATTCPTVGPHWPTWTGSTCPGSTRAWPPPAWCSRPTSTPLFSGPTGAAAVFGPQKGATTADVTVLEAALSHWADSVAAALRGSPPTMASPQNLPGAGAGGGVGFALLAVLGAERRSGVDVVLDLVGHR